MAATTEAVSLSTSAYVALSDGDATVLVHAEQPVRLHIGGSLPAADTDNWFPLEGGEEFHFEGLGSGDNVYALPAGAPAQFASLKMRVIRK